MEKLGEQKKVEQSKKGAEVEKAKIAIAKIEAEEKTLKEPAKYDQDFHYVYVIHRK